MSDSEVSGADFNVEVGSDIEVETRESVYVGLGKFPLPWLSCVTVGQGGGVTFQKIEGLSGGLKCCSVGENEYGNKCFSNHKAGLTMSGATALRRFGP
jgi:hypothetical protein